MAILREGLARCPVEGCPVRYASGGDHLCHDHSQPDDTPGARARMEAWRATLSAAPSEPDGGPMGRGTTVSTPRSGITIYHGRQAELT